MKILDANSDVMSSKRIHRHFKSTAHVRDDVIGLDCKPSSENHWTVPPLRAPTHDAPAQNFLFRAEGSAKKAGLYI